MINRPVNTSGLTGLIFTTLPHTLPSRTVEIGLMSITENSFTPDYSLSEYPITVSYGTGARSEMVLRGSYFIREEATAAKTRGAGDAELSWKWNVRQQPEHSISPAVALFATGIAPTGSNGERMNSVTHWGLRLGVTAGSELLIADYVLGIYADAQLCLQDLEDPELRDRYYRANIGVLFPISKHRNLQLLVEHNIMRDRDKISVDGVDFNAVTTGLRLVGERFNMTFGTQFIRRLAEGYEDSSKVVGIISMKL
jgi:hypothetical protein